MNRLLVDALRDLLASDLDVLEARRTSCYGNLDKVTHRIEERRRKLVELGYALRSSAYTAGTAPAP